jgi:hypothetical protein
LRGEQRIRQALIVIHLVDRDAGLVAAFEVGHGAVGNRPVALNLLNPVHREAFRRLLAGLMEIDAQRQQGGLVYPGDALAVNRVAGVHRHALQDARGLALDRLLAQQLVSVAFGAAILQVLVVKVGPDEASTPPLGRDAPHLVQCRQVQPLVGVTLGLAVHQKAGAPDVGGVHEAQQRAHVAGTGVGPKAEGEPLPGAGARAGQGHGEAGGRVLAVGPVIHALREVSRVGGRFGSGASSQGAREA